MNTFDLKTKILVTIVFLGILVAGYFSYQRTLVEKNFEIFDSEAETEEDAPTENALPIPENNATDTIEESAVASTSVNI
jgi:hypothetical protein